MAINNNTIEQFIPTELEKIEALKKAGFFDLESGKVEVNVNNCQVQNIIIHRMVYKRNKTVV